MKGTERDEIRSWHQSFVFVKDKGVHSILPHILSPSTPSVGLCQCLILQAELKMVIITQISGFANAEHFAGLGPNYPPHE